MDHSTINVNGRALRRCSMRVAQHIVRETGDISLFHLHIAPAVNHRRAKPAPIKRIQIENGGGPALNQRRNPEQQRVRANMRLTQRNAALQVIDEIDATDGHLEQPVKPIDEMPVADGQVAAQPAEPIGEIIAANGQLIAEIVVTEGQIIVQSSELIDGIDAVDVLTAAQPAKPIAGIAATDVLATVHPVDLIAGIVAADGQMIVQPSDLNDGIDAADVMTAVQPAEPIAARRGR